MSNYEDFESLSYEDLKKEIDEMYEDNRWSFICSGAVIYKYKNQYVKITVAKDEDDL